MQHSLVQDVLEITQSLLYFANKKAVVSSVNISVIECGTGLLSVFPNLLLHLLKFREVFHCGLSDGLCVTITLFLERLYPSGSVEMFVQRSPSLACPASI